jgi:hypothetical protein
MGIRDNDLKRLQKYAEGLGIKVVWKQWKENDPDASWTTDGSEITIYEHPRQSKTDVILSFIHELGHHQAWIYNGRKEDLKTNRALDLDEKRKTDDPPIPKEQRKLIYESEKNDADYQDLIFKELNLNIPYKKFIVNKKLDVWMYYRYYITGEYPTQTERDKKRKQLNGRRKVRSRKT